MNSTTDELLLHFDHLKHCFELLRAQLLALWIAIHRCWNCPNVGWVGLHANRCGLAETQKGLASDW